jgi:glycosyltransferase involved in cell wall biosynthesis
MSLRISVVVPTYNRAEFLPATLDSILAQTLAPAEVIVVDDGSTDDTAEVVRKYEPRVKYMAIENSGVCRARNAGVRSSTGNWIAFCDSDDLWRSGKLMLEAELARKAPEAAFIFSNFTSVRNNVWSPRDNLSENPGFFDSLATEEIGPDLILVKETLYPKVVRLFSIAPSAILISREYFDQIGGEDERFSREIAEDFEFVLRCVRRAPIGVVTRPMVGMRKHEGNVSLSQLRNLVSKAKILEFAREHHGLSSQYGELIHETLLQVRIEAADRAFFAGEYDIVRKLVQPLSSLERPWKIKLKRFVSGAPEPVRTVMAKAALGFPKGCLKCL